MNRLDRGDDGHIRANHRGQRENFVSMIHADLENAELGVARHARECQRNAPMIVVGCDRCVRPALLRDSAIRIASLVPVLPTEPVIATIAALLRARAAIRRGRAWLSRTSGTTISRSDPANTTELSPVTRRPPRRPCERRAQRNHGRHARRP